MDSDRSDGLLGMVVGVLVAIAVAILLVPARSAMDNTNVALVMVFAVVAGAALGGRTAGASTAIAAALAFDFFHTEPYLHLKIESSDDVVTTVLLLAIGLLAGQLAGLARRRKRAAEEGHSEIVRLWRVAEQAVRGADIDDVALAVRAELLALLRLSDCRFERGGTLLPLMEGSGRVAGTEFVYREGGFELPTHGVALPVRVGDRVFGHLLCQPTPGVGVSVDRRHAAVALADQLGLALAAHGHAGDNGRR